MSNYVLRESPHPSPLAFTSARAQLAGRGQPKAPMYIGTSRSLPVLPTLFRDPGDRTYDWVISDLEHDVMYQRGTMGIPPHVMANLQRREFRQHDWHLVIAHEISKVNDEVTALTPEMLSDRVLAMPNASTLPAARLDRSVSRTSSIVRHTAKAAALAAGAVVIAGARLVVADPVLLGALRIDGGWAVYVLAVWGGKFG